MLYTIFRQDLPPGGVTTDLNLSAYSIKYFRYANDKWLMLLLKCMQAKLYFMLLACMQCSVDMDSKFVIYYFKNKVILFSLTLFNIALFHILAISTL